MRPFSSYVFLAALLTGHALSMSSQGREGTSVPSNLGPTNPSLSSQAMEREEKLQRRPSIPELDLSSLPRRSVPEWEKLEKLKAALQRDTPDMMSNQPPRSMVSEKRSSNAPSKIARPAPTKQTMVELFATIHASWPALNSAVDQILGNSFPSTERLPRAYQPISDTFRPLISQWWSVILGETVPLSEDVDMEMAKVKAAAKISVQKPGQLTQMAMSGCGMGKTEVRNFLQRWKEKLFEIILGFFTGLFEEHLKPGLLARHFDLILDRNLEKVGIPKESMKKQVKKYKKRFSLLERALIDRRRLMHTELDEAVLAIHTDFRNVCKPKAI